MKSDPETAVKRAVTGKMDIGYIFWSARIPNGFCFVFLQKL